VRFEIVADDLGRVQGNNITCSLHGWCKPHCTYWLCHLQKRKYWIVDMVSSIATWMNESYGKYKFYNW